MAQWGLGRLSPTWICRQSMCIPRTCAYGLPYSDCCIPVQSVSPSARWKLHDRSSYERTDYPSDTRTPAEQWVQFVIFMSRISFTVCTDCSPVWHLEFSSTTRGSSFTRCLWYSQRTYPLPIKLQTHPDKLTHKFFSMMETIKICHVIGKLP